MDGWKQNLYRGSSKNEQKQQQQCEAIFVLITPGDVYGFFKKYGHAPDISGNINKKTGAAEIFILLRNGKDQTEFWRKHSQKHVDNRWKEQVKNVYIIFWAKNKCKRNGNKWRKRKADHIKNHMRRLKEATGCPKTEVPISARMTSIVQKMATEKNCFILRSRRLFLPTTKANSSMAKIFVMDRAT